MRSTCGSVHTKRAVLGAVALLGKPEPDPPSLSLCARLCRHLNVTRKAAGSLMERHTAGARLQRPADAVPASQQQLWASQQAVWEWQEWEVISLLGGVPLTHVECAAAGFPQYRMAERGQEALAELGLYLGLYLTLNPKP